MTDVKQDIALTYRGWGQIVQVNSTDEESSLTFPLNETKTYSIANAEYSDLTLPAHIQSKLLVHVDKDGQIEIENVCTPSSNPTSITLNDNELKNSDKAAIVENTKIKIGSVTYLYDRLETPGSLHLKNLFGSLQCPVCLRFLENPRSLSCLHVFCQPCFKSLVQTANGANANRQTGSGRGQPSLYIGLTDDDIVACPVCRKPSEIIARPQKVLCEVSKQFQEMIDGRPVCAMCSNQRWLMHGSDYYFCDTCQNILCPLCALDMHRSHKLRSTLENMSQASRDYISRTSPAKQEWTDIVKQVKDNKSNIKKTIAWIDNFKEQLMKMEQSMDDTVAAGSTANNEVRSLQPPRLGENVEAKREVVLSEFDILVVCAGQDMPKITNAINAKLNVINNAQKEIEILIANETLSSNECAPKEKITVKKLDTPKSNSSSATS